eukprot:5136057-Karenia_brevis.AAC.1
MKELECCCSMEVYWMSSIIDEASKAPPLMHWLRGVWMHEPMHVSCWLKHAYSGLPAVAGCRKVLSVQAAVH